MSPRDQQRLAHIASACDRVAEYTHEGRETLDDPRTLDAVLHCLAVIGEALGALSGAAYSALPSVPEGLPRAQRNLIVHEYWRIDPAVIWTTVDRSLPALRRDVADALNS